ncbi:type VI secretion system baseplate subunit TssG [Paracoccus marinaquae]|uniref:Type VI secretion system baseplate subunit TssG n=1 Tax=Paracoccus marinaquae TaxID=2841926 RepID=A0ABS6ALY7_9RHOB|nr:type VI secretion system baseplate subunit TssG [Paracoccus marinaquae]MBU3031504.1 type VI secretion system baseplate subunit TssG [Paracoccus marinaquae]
MADDDRHPGADLTADPNDATVPEIADMDFFELLRQLETATMRFGRAGGAAAEPARLAQQPRQSFAASDLAEFTPGRDGRKPQIAVNVLGLIGPEGPMPLHLTRWIIARQSSRWFAGADSSGATADTSFLDFINMMQHRMMALYWRAWADARPSVQIAHDDGGRVLAIMRALAGIGLPGSRSSDPRIDGAKLRHATSLAQEVRGPDRLISFLQSVLGVPVALSEFVGVWLDIPDHLQTRIGVQHNRLNAGAMVGGRRFDRQSRAEIRLGPLTRAQFDHFIDDPRNRARLRQAVVFAQGNDIDFDLRLVLAAGEVPRARLGHCRLGLTTWIDPKENRDADDLCYTRVNGEAEVPKAERDAA